MHFRVTKATPIIARQSGHVAGWLCTIHADFEGGTGFDELKFGVLPHEQRPLNEWTAVRLREFLDRECPLHQGFKRFVGLMAFRRDYEIRQDFSLCQLGGEPHVQLTCSELS